MTTDTPSRAFVVMRDTKSFAAGAFVYEYVIGPLTHTDEQVPVTPWPGQQAATLVPLSALEQLPTCGQRTCAIFSGVLSKPCALEQDHHQREHQTSDGTTWEDECGWCSRALYRGDTVKTPETGCYAGVLFCGACVTRCVQGGNQHTCILCDNNRPPMCKGQLSKGHHHIEPVTGKCEVPDPSVPDLRWTIAYEAYYHPPVYDYDEPRDHWRTTVHARPEYPDLDLNNWFAVAKDEQAHIPIRVGGEYVLPVRVSRDALAQAVKDHVTSQALPALADKFREQLNSEAGQEAEDRHVRAASRFCELRTRLRDNPTGQRPTESIDRAATTPREPGSGRNPWQPLHERDDAAYADPDDPYALQISAEQTAAEYAGMDQAYTCGPCGTETAFYRATVGAVQCTQCRAVRRVRTGDDGQPKVTWI